MEKERDELQGIFSNIERLRGLLYGNKFMEFVAGEYLSDISESATELLLKLTNGRYFIRYVQGFFVGDNFNGGELRSVNTLSGGETFQASLSLALGLADEVQSSAGGIRLDTMFVDEGFGSLDEESLQQAIQALTGLTEGNRLVGIISHVSELKERIDKQIIVTKERTGGSHVEIVV